MPSTRAWRLSTNICEGDNARRPAAEPEDENLVAGLILTRQEFADVEKFCQNPKPTAPDTARQYLFLGVPTPFA